jgi:hypothetical protein
MPGPTFSSTRTHIGAYMLPALWHILGPTLYNTVARTAILTEDSATFHTVQETAKSVPHMHPDLSIVHYIILSLDGVTTVWFTFSSVK